MAKQIINKVVHRFDTAVSSFTFASTDVDVTNDTIRVANHGLKTGDVIGIDAGTTIPTGLTEATTGYYIIVVDSSTIALATSKANAIAGTKINITAAGAGTNTCYVNGAGVVDLGVLPNKFVITDAWVDVTTTYTSTDGSTPGNDAGTLALSTGQSANDLVSAIAISDSSNVWDAGFHGTLRTDGNFGADAAHDTALEVIAIHAGAKLKLTADRIATLTFATETATAGALSLYVEGYQSPA